MQRQRGMLATLRTAALYGVEACPVQVEVDVSFGMPMFIMVGLPDASVRESRDRVRAAIKNSGFEFPPHRITVNLAPADVRKAGASFDLPIALGILVAQGVLTPESVADYGLWERGALAGPKPEAAYYVNVGLGQTMTPHDVLEGRMVVEIGVAAVRPAEFIVLRFSHKLQTE